MGIEIEKKFLVTTLPENLGPGIDICQGYLVNTPEKVVRVRISGGTGYLTIKGMSVNHVRPEFEYVIPETDAQEMLERFCNGRIVQKIRHTCLHEGMAWIIDRFSGDSLGLVVAEIELSSPDQPFSVPPWAGPEITDDPRYLNANLATHPYQLW